MIKKTAFSIFLCALSFTPVFAVEKIVPSIVEEKRTSSFSLSDDFFSVENQSSEIMRVWRSTTLNTQYIADYFASLPGVSYAFFHLTPLPDEHSKDKNLRLTREYLVKVQSDEKVMSMSRQVLKTIQEIMRIQPDFYQAYLNLLNYGYMEKMPNSVKIVPEKILEKIKKCEKISVVSVFNTLSQTDAELKQILEIYKKFTPFYEKEFNSFEQRN